MPPNAAAPEHASRRHPVTESGLPQWLTDCHTRLTGPRQPALHAGYCHTTAGEGDCARGHSGAWEMGRAGSTDGLTGVSACLRRCETCAQPRGGHFAPPTPLPVHLTHPRQV